MVLQQPIEIKVAIPQELNVSGNKYKSLLCLHPAFTDGTIFFERLNFLDFVEYKKQVLICPNLPNSYFANSIKGNFADFLDFELYPYVHNLLPISNVKDDNRCLGISMGAYGALTWALRKPEYFGTVYCISGYYYYRLNDDPRLKNQRKSYMLSKLAYPHMKIACESNGAFIESKDIIKQIKSIRNLSKIPLIKFLCGKNDYLSLNQTKFFYEELAKLGINTSIKLLEGEHDIRVWRKLPEIII